MDDLLGKKKKNLKPGLNIAKIYRQYIMKCIEKGRQVVSNHKFREIFNTEVNLAFKRRHTDTCKTCDAFNAALQNPQLTNEERQKVQQEQREHRALAKRVLETFQKDKENAKKDQRYHCSDV